MQHALAGALQLVVAAVPHQIKQFIQLNNLLDVKPTWMYTKRNACLKIALLLAAADTAADVL